MDLLPKVILANSEIITPVEATAATLIDNIIVRRSESVTDYAASVMVGDSPVLSYTDFCDRFGSSDSDIALVTDFANTAGFIIEDTHSPSATVKLSGTVSQINAAFEISLHTVKLADKSYMSYSGSIQIPVILQGVVEHVLGLDTSIRFNRIKNSISQAATVLTPIQVAAAYNFPNNNGYGQCIGILEWGGGYTTQNLTSSFTPLGLANPTTVDILTDGATNNPSDVGDSGEVMLDIFVAGAVCPNSLFAMYFGGGNGNPSQLNWYNNFNAAIHDTVNNPCVLSISWGAGEVSYWPPSNLPIFDALFSQSVALGITMLASSGDYGSTWSSSSPEVLYPASSVYITACGGTTLQLSGSSRSSETGWTGSGGGLSVRESLQSWQSGLSYTTYGYPSGPTGSPASLTVRGVPDIAGNADPASGYSFYYSASNTFISGVGGTSAVCPLMAGLIARLVQLSGTRIGYANPFFYANPAAFYDVTSGENAAYVNGYTCTTGWDAVTGLGVPIGTSLYKILNTGAAFPKKNFGFRPTTGPTYPRISTGARVN
jgi:kumamolisin